MFKLAEEIMQKIESALAVKQFALESGNGIKLEMTCRLNCSNTCGGSCRGNCTGTCHNNSR